jgi:integrase
MTVVRIKGFKIFRDRHGHERCYHRKTGIKIDLKTAPLGSAEFMAECARIRALTAVTAAKPGTLGLLIKEYRAHAAFTDLAPRTRSDYQAVFDYLKPIDDTPLVKFDKPLIVRIRDKAAKDKGRKFANDVKARFSGILGWGSERGYVATNMAAGIKDIRRRKDAPDANRPWSDDERDAVLAACPAHIRPAVALMMFTGLGPKDALTLPRSFYRANEIATRRSKTGEPVFWRCPAQLAEILAAAPVHNAITLCANSDGKPWTVSGFRASWRPVRHKLELEGKVGSALTLYGLRHTVAVILREMGYDDRAIADALGQSDPKMALHYAKGADLKKKMRGMVDEFDVELDKRRTKPVNPDLCECQPLAEQNK